MKLMLIAARKIVRHIAIAGSIFTSTFFTVAAQTEPIEKGWNGILPLQSTKADVEKSLGKPFRVEEEGHLSYQTEEFIIQVNYVPGPCQPNQYKGTKINAPAGTVLDLWVYLKKLIPVSDLNFTRPGYKRHVGEDPNEISYISSESGINVGAMIFPDKKEKVVTITYRPTEKAKLKFACP